MTTPTPTRTTHTPPHRRTRVEEIWQHREFVHELSRGIVGDPVVADRIVRETYVSALHHLDRLDTDSGMARNWLVTAVRRRSLDERRRRAAPLPADSIPATRASTELGRAITALTDRELIDLARRVDVTEA